MTSSGVSKIYKHPKAATLYITIPSDVVKDSTFPFTEGDTVTVLISDEYPGTLTILKGDENEVKQH